MRKITKQNISILHLNSMKREFLFNVVKTDANDILFLKINFIVRCFCFDRKQKLHSHFHHLHFLN